MARPLGSPGEALTAMRFRVRYRGHREVEATIAHDSLTIGSSGQTATQLPLRVRDAEYRFDPGGVLEVPLHHIRS
ncbi:glycosyl hydrolase family 65 protein [Geodermatophilus sabuli]|uniref:glycosyl hydrolase family 65 protein n=1 Tax=Geodermatophilus sabuli TaxID=1564158 RepID=UPI0021A76393|nr:glycosyl hydrolase family 65 protein [Geodermatophilus sabuli]